MVAKQLEDGLITEDEAEHFLELIEAQELEREVYNRYFSLVSEFSQTGSGKAQTAIDAFDEYEGGR